MENINNMYIQSFISKGQHVFGNYQINLSRKGEPLSQEKANQMEISEIVTERDPNKKNHYTFIIGENGSGKTSLLKSLTVGLLSKYTDYNWTEIKQGGLGYLKYFSKPFEIYHDYDKNRAGFNAIAYWANYQFLRIGKPLESMYFEGSMGHYSSTLPVLRMLASRPSNLQALNKYLRGRDLTWRVEVEFLPQPHYEYEGHGDKWVEINPNLPINLGLLIRVLRHEFQLDNEPLNKQGTDFLSFLTNNSNFPANPHYPAKVQDALKRLAASNVFKEVMEAKKLYEQDQKKNSNDKEELRIYDGRENSAYIIEKDYKLTEDDIWIIPFLAELGIVRYDIFIDDVIIDDFSSGEKILIQLFCNLAPICEKIKRTNSYLILFDEPETSLHPKWQQQFPFLFKKVVEDIFGLTDSHFIFCTHSPLIIMKAVELPNSSVLRFTYENMKFNSEKITDINRYCVEQLLLDEFGISYFSKEQINKMNGALEDMNPVEAILNTSQLKNKIDQLYKEVAQ